MTQSIVAPEGSLAAVYGLLADYARYIDAGDAESWSDLFEGGSLVFGELEISGRESLVKFAERSKRGVHVQGLPSVRLRPDGDFDSVSSFVFVSAGTGEILSGSYIDHISRKGESFVFARREIDIRAKMQH